MRLLNLKKMSGRRLALLGWMAGCVWSAAAIAATAPLHVLVDPGHGGKDHGAVHGQWREADLTLTVSQILHELLSSDARFKSSLTRKSDHFLDLSERVALAQAQKADLLVSIHVNWSKDTTVHGVEVYFQNQLAPDEESMFLAARENQVQSGPASVAERLDPMQTAGLSPEVSNILMDLTRTQRIFLSSQLARQIRGHWQGNSKRKSSSIRQAPFHVVINSPVPAALIEVGYLSHPEESKKLVDPEFQRQVATNLHRGLIAYKESLDKKLTSGL